jgi:hypothetical protein
MEIGVGFLKNNTREKLVEHMKDYDYNQYIVDYEVNWFDPKDSVSFHIEHPYEEGISSSFFCKLFYRVNSKSKLGLVLNYDSFGYVRGNNNNFEEYQVEIDALEIFPTFKFEPSKFFALTLAPGIIINTTTGTFKGYTSDIIGVVDIPETEKNRKISGGVNLGTYFQIPIKRCYLFAGANCSIQTKFSTGTLNSSSKYPLPALKINNSYAGLIFGVGFLLY